MSVFLTIFLIKLEQCVVFYNPMTVCIKITIFRNVTTLHLVNGTLFCPEYRGRRLLWNSNTRLRKYTASYRRTVILKQYIFYTLPFRYKIHELDCESSCPSACISSSLISEKASRISIKFRIRRTALTVLGEFLFCAYWSDMMCHLRGDQIEIHEFSSAFVQDK
jgi:hypothetical protein